MCDRVFHEVSVNKNERMLEELRKIVRDPKFAPRSGMHICSNVLWTCYMASEFSGVETRRRAKALCAALGANHSSIMIDPITDAVKSVYAGMEMHHETTAGLGGEASGEEAASGGAERAERKGIKRPDITASHEENIALQNIQARSRMVMAYFMAQLLPWQCNTNPENKWPGKLIRWNFF